MPKIPLHKISSMHLHHWSSSVHRNVPAVKDIPCSWMLMQLERDQDCEESDSAFSSKLKSSSLLLLQKNTAWCLLHSDCVRGVRGSNTATTLLIFRRRDLLLAIKVKVCQRIWMIAFHVDRQAQREQALTLQQRYLFQTRSLDLMFPTHLQSTTTWLLQGTALHHFILFLPTPCRRPIWN